jgi:hypothetical protein
MSTFITINALTKTYRRGKEKLLKFLGQGEESNRKGLQNEGPLRREDIPEVLLW